MLAFICLTSGAAAPAADQPNDDPFFYVLEGEFLGGYSKIPGRDGTASSIDRWLVSPVFRLNDRLHSITIYNGSYNRSAQVVSQEEGGRQTNESQTHTLTTALKQDVNETWSIRPLFFTDWVFVNETEDEDFGQGLYDYRDIGGGLESTWITRQDRTSQDSLRLGFRFLDRDYPNYQSLLSLFDPNGSVETDEKNLQGYKTNLGFDSLSSETTSWGWEAIFFYKDYTDKRTIDLNGIRTGDTREDYLGSLNIYASRPINSEWSWRLDAQAALNSSNLDFYDTHNTLALADDNYIKGYFDYFSFAVQPSVTYRKEVAKDKFLTAGVTYSFNALHYPGRKAQDAAGLYLADDQQDYTHVFSGRLSVPLTPQWSWVTSFSYTLADSNQKFEDFYLYTYDLWVAVTGISIKY